MKHLTHFFILLFVLVIFSCRETKEAENKVETEIETIEKSAIEDTDNKSTDDELEKASDELDKKVKDLDDALKELDTI